MLLFKCSKERFIKTASFLIIILAAYGIGGLILNVHNLSPASQFRGQWPLNHKPGIIVLMGCQTAFILALIPGIIGLLKRVIIIFFVPAFIYLGVVATLVILGSITLKDSSRDLTHEIIKSLRVKDNCDGLNWISDIQWENECCGIQSYMDYNQLNFTGLELFSVPYSCCLRQTEIPKLNCGVGVIEPSKSRSEIESIIIAKGCNSAINKFQGQNLMALGAEMLMVGIITAFVTVYLYLGAVGSLNLETDEIQLGNENQSGQIGFHGEGDSVAAFRNTNSIVAQENGRPILKDNKGKRVRSSSVSFADDEPNNNNNPGNNDGEGLPPKRQRKMRMKPKMKPKKQSKKAIFQAKLGGRKQVAKPSNQGSTTKFLFKQKKSMATPASSRTRRPQDFLMNYRLGQLEVGLSETDTQNFSFTSNPYEYGANKNNMPLLHSHNFCFPQSKSEIYTFPFIFGSESEDSKAKAFGKLRDRIPPINPFPRNIPQTDASSELSSIRHTSNMITKEQVSCALKSLTIDLKPSAEVIIKTPDPNENECNANLDTTTVLIEIVEPRNQGQEFAEE